MSFSGSYHAQDVQFLLKPLPQWDFTQVSEKESLIQSGTRHYSEMLSPETLPSERYLQIFKDALVANREKMARDCLALAAIILEQKKSNTIGAASKTSMPKITLVSLARAGTPIGVILKKILAELFDCEVMHYSISIIRDRGIDACALQHILSQGHAPESIAFIDGWTGKGVISAELNTSVAQFNRRHNSTIDAGLYVLADLAGSAAFAATCDDYLIPSSILNATVSGLVSRSILNASIGENDFHGCVYYEQFMEQDQSRSFAQCIFDIARQGHIKQSLAPCSFQGIDAQTAAAISQACLRRIMQKYGIVDINLIKPGIGEATRVLLRRVPKLLVLRNRDAIDVRHLLVLAQEKNVMIELDEELPYQALSIIRSASDA